VAAHFRRAQLEHQAEQARGGALAAAAASCVDTEPLTKLRRTNRTERSVGGTLACAARHMGTSTVVYDGARSRGGAERACSNS
jgi:hypothetical protein